MHQTYFHRVSEQSQTRFWINNPTLEEARQAIDAGAVGCTCNPSYCQKLLDHPLRDNFAWRTLQEAVLESSDDSEAQVIMQRKLAKPIAELFLSLHDRNPRRDGFVTIQGNPLREHDPNAILQEALGNRAIARNICVKVPVTASGLKTIDALVSENIAIAATEVFGISQAVALCDGYERASNKSGKRPVIFLAHIAGIYDDYLKAYVEREKIGISPDVLWQAGLTITRRVYDLLQERGYSPILMGGGARGPHHFTELVGGDLIVTINWRGTADKLLKEDPPVVYRLFNPVPARAIDELMEKLPDFRRGYLIDGLDIEEFENFGPVELFRSSFIKSWERVLGLASELRAKLNAAGRL